MAKDMQIAYLLDFYGELLTEKQREVVELYYNQDLSLSEIADEYKISRQGVRDNIKRAEMSLISFEEKLGLAGRFRMMESALGEIIEEADGIAKILESQTENGQEVAIRAQRIIEAAKRLQE